MLPFSACLGGPLMHHDMEIEHKPHASFHSLGAIFTSPFALKRISLRVFFFFLSRELMRSALIALPA